MELEEGEEGEIAYAPSPAGAPAPATTRPQPQHGIPPLPPPPRGPPGQHAGYGAKNSWEARGPRPGFGGGPRGPGPRGPTGRPGPVGVGAAHSQGQGPGYKDVRDIRANKGSGAGPVWAGQGQGGTLPPPLPLPSGPLQGGGPRGGPRGPPQGQGGSPQGQGGSHGGPPPRGPLPPRAGMGLLHSHTQEVSPGGPHQPSLPGPRGIALRDVRDAREGLAAAPRPLGLLGSIPQGPGQAMQRSATAPPTQGASLLGGSTRPPLAASSAGRGGTSGVLGSGPLVDVREMGGLGLLFAPTGGTGGATGPRALLSATAVPSGAAPSVLGAGQGPALPPTGLVGARASLMGSGLGTGPGGGVAPRPSGLLGSGAAAPLLGSAGPGSGLGLLGRGSAGVRAGGSTGPGTGVGKQSLMGGAGGSAALLQDVRGDRMLPFGAVPVGRASLLGSELAHRGLAPGTPGPGGPGTGVGGPWGRGLMGPGRDWRGAASDFSGSYDHRSDAYGFGAGLGGGGVLGGGPGGSGGSGGLSIYRAAGMAAGRPGEKDRQGYPHAAGGRPGEARMGARDDMARAGKPAVDRAGGVHGVRGAGQDGSKASAEEEEEEEAGSLADQEDEEERERAEAAAKAKAEAEARAAKYSLVSFTRAAEGTQVPSRFASALLPVLSMHADSAAAKALTEAGAGPAPAGADVPAGMVVQGGFSFSSPLPLTLTSARVVGAMEAVDNLVRAVTDAIAALETTHLSALKQEVQSRKEAYAAQLAAQAEKEKAKREAEEAAATAAAKQAEEEANAAASRAASGSVGAASSTAGAVVVPLHVPTQVTASQLADLCGVTSPSTSAAALHLLKVISSWTHSSAWLAQASGAPFERLKGKDKASAEDGGDRNAQVQRFIKRTALPSFLQAVDLTARRASSEGVALLIAQGIHVQEPGVTALLCEDEGAGNLSLPLNERIALQEGGGSGCAVRVLVGLPQGWAVTIVHGSSHITLPAGTPKVAVVRIKTSSQDAPPLYAVLASSLALLHAACPPLVRPTSASVLDVPPLLAGNTRKRMQAGQMQPPAVLPATCIVPVSAVHAHARFWKACASDRAKTMLANRGKAVWSAMHLQRLHKKEAQVVQLQYEAAGSVFPNGQGRAAYASAPGLFLGKSASEPTSQDVGLAHRIPVATADGARGASNAVPVPAEGQFHALRTLKAAAFEESAQHVMDTDGPDSSVSSVLPAEFTAPSGSRRWDNSAGALVQHAIAATSSPVRWMAEASSRAGGYLHHPSLPRSLQGRILDLDQLALLSPAIRAAALRWTESLRPRIHAVLEHNKRTHAAVRDYFLGHVHRQRAIIRARQISEAHAYVASRIEWAAQVRKHLRARKVKASIAHAAADLRLAASPRPGNILERTGRRAAAVAAAAAIAGKGPVASSSSAASGALGASGDSAHGVDKDTQPDPVDPAADLPSDSEDDEGGIGGAVRSEWELQQRLEALAVRERKATARLYMTATVPDRIPDKQSRARTRLRYNGTGRYSTDGAPALCSHVPAHVPCTSAIRPMAGQAHAANPSLLLPADVAQGSARSKKMLLTGYSGPFSGGKGGNDSSVEEGDVHMGHTPVPIGSREALLSPLSSNTAGTAVTLHSMVMTSVDECRGVQASPAPPTQQHRVDCVHNIAKGASLPWINGSCNCAVAVELAYKATNPWSDMEKLIFMDVFMAHPKDFTRIAAYLPNKTANDCIAFYYATKHVAGYKQRLKAIANWTKKRAGTSAHWLQVCGAARDIGVPIPADISRGAVLKDRSRKLAIIPSRMTDLAYSRLFQHPGPYARVTALHRLVTLPLPLTAQSQAVAPLAALAEYYNGGLPGAGAPLKLHSLPAVVPGANADFPDHTRNEFIHGYGLGHPSLPWGSKFQARIQGQEESEADPLQYMPTPAAAAAGAGAGVGASLVRVYLSADTYNRSTTSTTAGASGGGTRGTSAAYQAHLAMQAAELSRRGIYSHVDLWRLTPPSLLPQSGTQIGQIGNGAGGAWTAARFPLPPSALLEMGRHLVKGSAAMLTGFDDERAIALSWKAMLAAESRPWAARPGTAAKLHQYTMMVDGLTASTARPAASMALPAIQRFFDFPASAPIVSSLLPPARTYGTTSGTAGALSWPMAHDLAGLLAATHAVAAYSGGSSTGGSHESSDAVLSPRGKESAPVAGPGSRPQAGRANRSGAQEEAALPPGWYPVSGTGPVSVAALGDIYQPTGPTVTLRYFDPLSAPSVLRCPGDQEGLLPYGWLLATADEADAVDVLYARAKARGHGAKARVRKTAVSVASSRSLAQAAYKRELNHNVSHAVATQIGASAAHDAALNALAEAVRSTGPLFPYTEDEDGTRGHMSDGSEGEGDRAIPSTSQRVQALSGLSRDLNAKRGIRVNTLGRQGAASSSLESRGGSGVPRMPAALHAADPVHTFHGHATGQGGLALSSTESTPYHSEDEDAQKPAVGGVPLGRAFSAPPVLGHHHRQASVSSTGSAALAGVSDEQPHLAHAAHGSVDGNSAGDSEMLDASPLTEAYAYEVPTDGVEVGTDGATGGAGASSEGPHETLPQEQEEDGQAEEEVTDSYTGVAGVGLGVKRSRAYLDAEAQQQAEAEEQDGQGGGWDAGRGGEYNVKHEAKHGRFEASEEEEVDAAGAAAWQAGGLTHVPPSLASAGFTAYSEVHATTATAEAAPAPAPE